VMMAEDGIRRASQEAASCAAPAVAAVAPRAAPAPVPAPAPVIVQAPAPAPIVQTITRESFVLLGDTLFKFNKSGINDLLPGGIERLNGIAQRLKTYQSLSTMRIIGHTDRYGSEEYNNDLSTRRASTVRTYLESQGIRASNTEVSGMGESQPVTKCSTSAPRATQIACLQPDRRVNIDVTGFVK
jgi:OmpA-OmpF porin, OOP family